MGVTDGDTLTVLKADRTQVKIRLYGIDAPEIGQDFGARAKQLASELAFGQGVTILTRDTDRYGRTVAEVILPDGRSLNHEMVGRGMAWWYRRYAADDTGLAGLEAEARTARRGLWGQDGPTPPWAWRKGEGPSASIEFVGNRRSRVFHSPRCPSVGRMKAENRATFRTAAEAERMGFRKAGDCR